MAKYVSSTNLSYFLSKLKTIFSDTNHIHTIAEIDGLQISLDGTQEDVNNLEQTVAELESTIQYNILPITQDEYDALTEVDENTLYIIEV